ncbi:hypothetical protein PVK06_026466 [Gossypium arboreum]|uniref:Reverse transcriptase domain-containing protein n=1 Tax=Gossypium arboreum TaxID=29729 RepID=A0ABR0NXT9_GOSAR|nr:hypothetical protein PVK06_026466 [Gossypium arboreum]
MKEEVVTALKEIGPMKTSGEDGFLAIFFQQFWHILGGKVTDYCLGILNRGLPVDRCNFTNIVLITKVFNLMNLGNFRPISLCNVLYKIMAKMIANLFESIISNCIDSAQSAFVLDKLISDNVLLAYEILHTFRQKGVGKKGFTAFKLDISKAYDKVECEGLYALITMALMDGSIKGEKASRGGPSISHLLFSDDSVLFGEGSKRGA